MKPLNFTFLFSLAIPFFTFAQTLPECTLPFFSEMIDGHPKNKVLEIYNPSEIPIVADDLSVLQFINGNNTPIAIQLSGVIAPKETFVLANQNANSSMLANTNQVSNKLNFNGNDAIALVYTGMLPPDLNEFPVPQNAFIDIIGEIGVNPGNSGWAVGGGGSTSNHGLRRKEEVRKPEMNWGLSRMQWTSTATTVTSNLGQHVSECATRQEATVRFEVTASTFPEDYFNSTLGNNTIQLNIIVSGAHGDITVFVQDGAFFSPTCTGDLADGTDYSITNGSGGIFVPASSGGEVIQAELFLVDDGTVEPDENLCLDLNCLGISENCNLDPDFFYHTLTITDNDGTGIEDRAFTDLKIFPNLVQDNINISGLNHYGQTEIKIINTLGQVIYQEQTTKSSRIIHATSFESGVYYMKLTQDGITTTQMIVKQ